MGNAWTRHQLKNRTTDNTPEYNFKGQKLLGKIVSVYDGDTCTAAASINGLIQTIKVRCYGYDSPELRPSKKAVKRDVEIERAKAAKFELENLILHKIVTLEIHGFDKYGRFLATIYLRTLCGTLDVNAAMVSAGHGQLYFGGTKGKMVLEEDDNNIR